MADEPTGTPDSPSGTTAIPAADGAGEGGAGGAGVEETPEQLRARIAELEGQRKQDLARLTTGEEATRRAETLAAELDRERAGRGYQPPTASNPALEQFQRDYQELAERDPAAARLIAGIGAAADERVTQAERRAAYRAEMDAVPSDLKPEVDRRMKETPGLSPFWATKAIKADRLDKEQSDLDERRRRLDEEEAARKRGRVDTTVTGIRGSDLHNAGITAAELNDLSRKAEAGDSKAIERLRAFDRGELGRLKES